MSIQNLRSLVFAMLAFLVAGCSGAAIPSNQSAATSTGAARVHGNAHMQPDTACPSGGITFAPGDNGTYSLAVGHSCDLYGPADETCLPGEIYGLSYTFFIESGAGLGTLTPTTQTGGGSKATYTRNDPGNVVIGLRQYYLNPITCKPQISTYGKVTLD